MLVVGGYKGMRYSANGNGVQIREAFAIKVVVLARKQKFVVKYVWGHQKHFHQ